MNAPGDRFSPRARGDPTWPSSRGNLPIEDEEILFRPFCRPRGKDRGSSSRSPRAAIVRGKAASEHFGDRRNSGWTAVVKPIRSPLLLNSPPEGRRGPAGGDGILPFDVERRPGCFGFSGGRRWNGRRGQFPRADGRPPPRGMLGRAFGRLAAGAGGRTPSPLFLNRRKKPPSTLVGRPPGAPNGSPSPRGLFPPPILAAYGGGAWAPLRPDVGGRLFANGRSAEARPGTGAGSSLESWI